MPSNSAQPFSRVAWSLIARTWALPSDDLTRGMAILRASGDRQQEGRFYREALGRARREIFESQLALLQCQQFLFDFEPATISGELAVAADHAMARNNNRNRV